VCEHVSAPRSNITRARARARACPPVVRQGNVCARQGIATPTQFRPPTIMKNSRVPRASARPRYRGAIRRYPEVSARVRRAEFGADPRLFLGEDSSSRFLAIFRRWRALRCSTSEDSKTLFACRDQRSIVEECARTRKRCLLYRVSLLGSRLFVLRVRFRAT